jgi:hypothetical protein
MLTVFNGLFVFPDPLVDIHPVEPEIPADPEARQLLSMGRLTKR